MGLATFSIVARCRRIVAVALVVGMIITTSVLPAGAADPADIGRLEKLVYGKTNTGTFLDRLKKLERDLYGSEREGSIDSRSFDIYVNVSDNASSESLFWRLRAIEWKSGQPVNETNIVDRLGAMETYLFGEAQQGSIVSRVNQLVSLWFAGGKISPKEVVIPEGTAIELKLVDEVSSETATTGQIARLEVTKSLVVDGAVVIPAGAVAEIVVTEASPAGHAFKKAKLSVDLRDVKAIDGSQVPVAPESSVASEDPDQDTTTHLAVGASIAGLALLGPLGAAAGFLIKSEQIVLPAGLVVRAVVEKDSPVMGVSILPVSE